MKVKKRKVSDVKSVCLTVLVTYISKRKDNICNTSFNRVTMETFQDLHAVGLGSNCWTIGLPDWCVGRYIQRIQGGIQDTGQGKGN